MLRMESIVGDLMRGGLLSYDALFFSMAQAAFNFVVRNFNELYN